MREKQEGGKEGRFLGVGSPRRTRRDGDAVALLEVVALELPLIRASMRKKSSRVELRRSYANPTPIPPSNLPPYCENLQKRGAPRSVDFSICRPGPPT